jgi:hypothetical protein
MPLSPALQNTRLWLIVCLGTLGAMVVLSVLAHAFMPANSTAAGRVMLPVYFALFLLLGFSAVPLMTNLFVAGLERMWAGAGRLERPANARAMAFVHRHQTHFVIAVWAIYVVGLLIASPYIADAWREAF